MNLKDTKTQVTIGDSRTITGTKRGNLHGYHRCDRKLHLVTISNTPVIPLIHANLFRVIQSPQNVVLLKSKGEALILSKNSTQIRFDEKMVNKSCKGFLLTAKFYKSAKDTIIVFPDKWYPDGKTDIHLEGTAVNKQDSITTRKITTQNIHANKHHVKLGHPR